MMKSLIFQAEVLSQKEMREMNRKIEGRDGKRERVREGEDIEGENKRETY